MLARLKNFLFNRKGQSMTEYIIILALVAVAAIAATQVFGKQLRENLATIVSGLAGEARDTESFADTAKEQAKDKDLSDFASEK